MKSEASNIMHMKNYRPILVLLATLFVSGESDVHAEYNYGPFSLSAFGTLGGAWLSNPHADYVQGTQPVGPGLTHDFDLGLDSRLGAQLNATLTPTTLITAQAVVERLPDNEISPRLTLANIRQELSENFAIRIGRIQSPVFLASEYRLANFSNPWIRTPGVLYGIYPLTHLDSADLTYRIDSGLGIFSLNAGYGWLTYPIPVVGGKKATTALHMDDVVYANLKLENDPWRFKLSWVHGYLTAHTDEIDQALANMAVIDPIAASALQTDYLGVGLYTAGFSYEGTDWLVMSEWGIGLLDHTSLLSTTHGGYLTVGYHFDRWMPQITIGYQASSDQRVHSSNAFLDSSIDQLHRLQRSDYRTLAFGLNYSVTDSIILRSQVDLIEPMGHSKGPYLKSDAGYKFDNPGIDALFSLALDFVY